MEVAIYSYLIEYKTIAFQGITLELETPECIYGECRGGGGTLWGNRQLRGKPRLEKKVVLICLLWRLDSLLASKSDLKQQNKRYNWESDTIARG